MASELYNSYLTIDQRSEGTYSEKRSKFISFAIPVETEEEALMEVDRLRREYYDAHHVCWAYRIGKGEVMERANDDGEPSGSAGRPILGQIISQDLTDILVAVVRYFGGVKLGTGGLVVAYRTAAAEALAAATIRKHILYTDYQLQFPFDLINPVMMLLRQFDVEVNGNDADTEGHIWRIKVANQHVPDFEEKAKTLYRLIVKVYPN
ncbi:MAG: YigZ family protein [Porphyromonas sp.]|nr:YigZ family protein [Porphyromonas sp.]